MENEMTSKANTAESTEGVVLTGSNINYTRNGYHI